eukprot:gene10903-3607_t
MQGKSLEALNQKKTTFLCFLKPILISKNISGIQEIMQILLELGNSPNVNIVFVFSEKPNLIYTLLYKYNLHEKIAYISDPSLTIFEKFGVKKIYKNICECHHRNTHIFILKSNQILIHFEFSKEMPIEELKSFIPREDSKRKKEKNREKSIHFIENYYMDTDFRKKNIISKLFTNIFLSPGQSALSFNSSFSLRPKSPDNSSDSSSLRTKSVSYFNFSLKRLSSSKSVPNSPKISPKVSPRNSNNNLLTPRNNKSLAGNRLSNKSISPRELFDLSLFDIPKSGSDCDNVHNEKPPQTERNDKFKVSLSKRQLKFPRKSLGLYEILHSENAKSKFMEFSKMEYSEENVEFWDDVQNFKNIQDLNERSNEAERIFNVYLATDSKSEINVSGRLLKKVKTKLFQYLLENECPIDIFDSIVFELEINNLNDTLSRFKLTSTYQNELK